MSHPIAINAAELQFKKWTKHNFQMSAESFSTTSINRLNSNHTIEGNGQPFQRDRTLTRYRRSMKLNSHRSTGQWTKNIRALCVWKCVGVRWTHQGCGYGPVVSLNAHWPHHQREPEKQVEKRSRWKKEIPVERQQPHIIHRPITLGIKQGIYY